MHIRLFGSFQHIDSERPLVQAKARALLIYLLLFPDQAHPREKLADLLWPEAAPEQGRRWLSNALYELRQSLGECVVAGEGTVRLPRRSGWQVDVWAFDQLTQVTDTPALQLAIDLYVGDLVPEIYDDWVITPRLARRETYLATLEMLTEHLMSHHPD